MADTAIAWLPRHGAQWGGAAQLPATASIGPVIFAGPANLPIPAGVELVSTDGNGTQFITQAAANTGAGGSVTVQVQCEVTGSVGNIAAGATLDIISPILGLQNQTVTVGAGGLAGGTDPEATEALARPHPAAHPEAWAVGRRLGLHRVGRGQRCRADAGRDPELGGPGQCGVGVRAAQSRGAGPAGADGRAGGGRCRRALDQVRPVTAQVVALAAVQTPRAGHPGAGDR